MTNTNAPDLRRIKSNVAKMASMNAPEEDIDGYIASEGVTIEQVRDYQPSTKPNLPTKSLSTPQTYPDAPALEVDVVGGQPFDPNHSDPELEAYIEEQRRLYGDASPEELQAQIAAEDAPQSPPSEDHAESNGWRLPSVFANAANKGVAGIAGLPVDLATAGINALTPEWMGDIDPSKAVGGSASIKHLMDLPSRAFGYDPESFNPKNDTEEYLAAAGEGLGGAVLPAGGLIASGGRALTGGAAKRAFQKLANVAAASPARTLAVEAGGGAGAGLGAQAAQDAFPDNSVAPVIGGLVGGALGGAAAVSKPLASALGDARFTKAQASNPYASFDAEIAADTSRVVSSVSERGAMGQKLPKGQREATIVQRMDDLERSYLPYDDVKALDIPPSRKVLLKRAMDQRHNLGEEAIERLRGTPEGEAVADAITKARRLRHYVPEGSADVGRKGLLSLSLGSAGTAVGAAIAGPKGAAASRLIGHVLDSPSGRTSIPNAKAAKALAKLEPRFAKVREEVGPSSATQTGEALARSADAARDVSYGAQQASRAAKAREAAERVRLETEGQRIATRNALDNIKPNGGFRGYLYERTGLLPKDQDLGALRLVAEGKMTPEHFDMFLSSPEKLQTGNAGNAIMDRLAAMAEQGALTRDPSWTPSATGSDMPSNGIRNPLAYQATAKANQERVTQALASVRERKDLTVNAKMLLGSTVARVGNTASREVAELLVKQALKSLPKGAKEIGESILRPLVEQIR